jgi:hypothetical protein
MVHLALIAALAQVAITSSAPTMAAPSSSPTEALLIGDSVMNGMAQGYGATARAELAARHSFVLDTAGCRRLLGTSCSIGGRPRPTNAITELRAMAGQYRRELVVAAGYNDPTFGSEGLGVFPAATAVDDALTGRYGLVNVGLAEGVRAIVRNKGGVMWDGTGDNPYVAMLALADAIVVTSDSVNMVGEACATGRPVLLFEPTPRRAAMRNFRFIDGLVDAGAVRLFQGKLESYAYVALESTPAIAAAVADAYLRRRHPAPRPPA